MKKLLGLIGTITISGSGVAGLVGNAPAQAKNEINYLQTNNLETLKRNKRQYGWNDSSLDYKNYQLNNNLSNLGAIASDGYKPNRLSDSEQFQKIGTAISNFWWNFVSKQTPNRGSWGY